MYDENINIIIIKNIPCLVCENCGEIYFETNILVSSEKIVNDKKSKLEIIDYQKKVA